jgi:hypothetical protein
MTKEKGFKFPVQDVSINSKILKPISDEILLNSWSSLGKVQSFSKLDTDVRAVETFQNPSLLAASVYRAFYEHYPLKINPNVIWLTIEQGFSHYVDDNKEALRLKFVSFKGKKTLLVIRPDFNYQDPNNDWVSVFPAFAEQIEEYIGSKTQELLECNFSNTTLTDRAVSHITLMDVCKNYFKYEMLDGCGIPYIELMGTLADWKLIRQKAAALESFSVKSDQHLKNWLSNLIPALDHFVLAAEGHPDMFFWKSICNLAGLSGDVGDPITGWITVFFPYLGNEKKNTGGEWRRAYELAKLYSTELPPEERDYLNVAWGIDLKQMPSGLSKAPVKITWMDVGKEQKVMFYGGMTAMYQHSDRSLEVRTGWAVVEPTIMEPRVRKPRIREPWVRESRAREPWVRESRARESRVRESRWVRESRVRELRESRN